MPIGLDEALALAALSVACLKGCVEALTALSKAKHYTNDVSSVCLRIELEQHSLFTWAEEAGLTLDPPALRVSSVDAIYVHKILYQLKTLLSDLNQLKIRYGLRLEPTSENIETVQEGTVLSSLGPRQREYAQKTDSVIFSKRLKPWRRLKWIVLDEQKVDRLLSKVSEFIKELNDFLERSRRARIQRERELFLREAVLYSENQRNLDVIGSRHAQAPTEAAVIAAAKLKETKLALKLTDSTSFPARDSETGREIPMEAVPHHATLANGPSRQMRLKMRHLTLERAARSQTYRTLTHYNDEAVLLEWKYCTSGLDELEGRVDQIAEFLHQLQPSFHSLPCRGYVKDYTKRRYGYIFDLPSHFHSDSESNSRPLLPELKSLRQLFDQQQVVPSVNERLDIALSLLETLLNLHNAGFLHKELRSENIILIRRGVPERSGSSKGDSTDTTALSELSTYSVYISGYIHARADSPYERTEPLESELEPDLYRHPKALEHASYRKSFDVFSVGCTLLEIGLWSSLRDILQNHSEHNKGILGTSIPFRNSPNPSQPLSPPESPGRDTSSTARHMSHSSISSRNSCDFSHEQASMSLSSSNQKRATHVATDFKRLRYDLLISHFNTERPNEPLNMDAAVQNRDRPEPPRCSIMSSLEAATGKRYAKVVAEFLSEAREFSDSFKRLSVMGGGFNQHQHAFDLEHRARDTVRGILDAI